MRVFARYVATLDPESEVPSEDLLPARRPRVAPYIYSPAEISALMGAAGKLTPPLRAVNFRTVIGLMATTGLRLGEALGLDRHDVDLADGALHVRARQPKQREVPLHPTATRALRDYARLRNRRWPAPPSPAFFLGTRGSRLAKSEFNHYFAQLIRQVGLEGAGERVRPRPHDLRHTMAVRTLLDCYLQLDEIKALLRAPDRSTWLGRRDHALLLVAILTGVRVAELTGLRVCDITLGIGAHIHVVGKGRKERSPTLTRETIAVLRQWLKERQGQPEDPLFPTRQGQPLTRYGVRKLLTKHLAAAAAACPSLNVKHLTPQPLRHTNAMLLRAGEIDTATIALWLGHESTKTTRIYEHADPALKEQAIARIAPLGTKPGRYRPADALLAFLEGL